MNLQRLGCAVLTASMLLLSPVFAQARGFAILPSEGKALAGQKPPKDGARRTPALEGSELWLGPSPIIEGGIRSVRVASGAGGRPLIWLQLTPVARDKVAAYTASHVGQRLAYVLDGQVVGLEVTISMPSRGDKIAVATDQDRAAAERLAGRLAATISSRG